MLARHKSTSTLPFLTAKTGGPVLLADGGHGRDKDHNQEGQHGYGGSLENLRHVAVDWCGLEVEGA